MLFDLRGRGRRRTVQAIYLSLAILMGGGLVLFGIGSDQSGGLVDAISGDGAGGTSATESIDKRIDSAVAATKSRPRDPQAWAQLAILRYQRAGIDGVTEQGAYTADGLRRLGLAASAWERHLALDPKQPSPRAANLMVQAYGKDALDQLPKAVRAKQVVTAAEDPPSSRQYQQLALLAYQAKETRVGDLAAERAVDLAPEDQRTALRAVLKTLKTSASQQPSGKGIPEPRATG